MFRAPAQNFLLPLSLGAFCLGISVAGCLPSEGNTFLLLFFLPACLLLLLSLHSAGLRQGKLLLAVGLLFLMAGMLRSPGRDLTPPPGHAFHLFPEPANVSFVAAVSGLPVARNGLMQFEARLVDILTPGAWYHTFGRIRLSMPADAAIPPLPPGRMFLGRGKISAIEALKNPGAFDYQRFLAGKGIFLQGWIDAPEDIQTVETLPAPGPIAFLRLLPEKIRYRIHRFLYRSLAPLPAALYSAILIGDRSSLPAEVVENFKAAGAMHLLAISGLHVGMLAFFSLLFFTFLLRRFPALLHRFSMWKTAAALTLLPLTAYALIAGFQPPVVRSLLMFTILTIAVLAGRQPNLLNSIILAALLILAVTPEALFAVSFQLTFAAVLAIVLFTQHIYPGRAVLSEEKGAGPPTTFSRRLLSLILLSLACSVAASIGTAPLILHHFNRLSLLSPLSSLLLTPIFCFIALPLGFCACLLLPFFPALAHGLVLAGGKSLLLSAEICAALAHLHFADLYLPPPSWLEIFLAYGLFLALLYWKKGRNFKIAASLLAVLLVCTAFLQHGNFGDSDQAKVVFLDVGQGSAAVLHLPGGKTFVIDGGKRQRVGFDTGRSIIAPYLLRNNILRLDGIVLTHPHADHFNGLPFLIERFRPKKLWVASRQPTSADYAALLQTAGKAGTEILVPEPLETMLSQGPCRLSALNSSVLLTEAGDQAPHRPGINDGLLVKFSMAGHSLLFPGDIGRETEEYLAAAMPSFLRADILLASHHGSRGSNAAAFLARVEPSCIIVSTSRRTASLPAALQTEDADERPLILTTARQGAVCALLEKGIIELTAEGKNELCEQEEGRWRLRRSPLFGNLAVERPGTGRTSHENSL